MKINVKHLGVRAKIKIEDGTEYREKDEETGEGFIFAKQMTRMMKINREVRSKLKIKIRVKIKIKIKMRIQIKKEREAEREREWFGEHVLHPTLCVNPLVRRFLSHGAMSIRHGMLAPTVSIQTQWAPNCAEEEEDQIVDVLVPQIMEDAARSFPRSTSQSGRSSRLSTCPLPRFRRLSRFPRSLRKSTLQSALLNKLWTC